MTDTSDLADGAMDARDAARVAARRLSRQFLTRGGPSTPEEVARWFGAVQAQEIPGALYALGLRVPGATEASVERAVTSGTIVRTWPMRGTIHFIPAEDAAWMLALLGRRTNRGAASVYRRARLDDAAFARAGAVLREALAGGKAVARKELCAALDAAGLEANREQRGTHLVGYWAREGLVCLGPRQGKQATFTLLESWAANPRQLEGDAALAELATRYFTSHGPATEHDFAWWSGLTLTEVRRGLAAAGDRLARETIAGRTFWRGAAEVSGEAEALERTAGSVFLLPQYDEYTVAYRDRSITRDPAFPDDAFLILGPVVVVDGRVAGTWKRRLAKDGAHLAITLYVSLDQTRRVALDAAVAGYGRYLGLNASAEVTRPS